MLVYVLNIIICCYILHFYNVNNKQSYLIVSIFVIIIWTIIIGGQYGVGSDYFAYLNCFEYNYHLREPLFNFVQDISFMIGISGQGIFFVFALIDATILFIAIYKYKITNLSIFYFLIVTVSTYFNNSMNMLRQIVADVLIFYAFIEMFQSKLKGSLLIAIATGFHFSAMCMFIFIPIKIIIEHTTKFPKFLLIVTTILGSTNILNNDALNEFIFEIIPSIDELEYYKTAYAGSNLRDNMSIIYKISKVFYIPIYFISIKLLDGYLATNYEKFLFKLGLLSFCLRVILLQNNLIGRFSCYFWLPSVFPIYFLLKYYWTETRMKHFLLCSIYCMIPYLIKLIQGEFEYKYHFFLLQ